MKNEYFLMGLVQDMFENNIFTFNPGWDRNAHSHDSLDDVRAIQNPLKGKGVKLENEKDEKTSESVNIVHVDPDGYTILIDQHI